MAEFLNITKIYGERIVIKDFSLSLPSGSKTLLMGESGCGKTTLLRIAAGLTTPDVGSFTHNGRIAVMFQEHRLLPWKTAIDNICAVLPKESHSLAPKYLSAVGLTDSAKKYPKELSGGMAQRVAFARFLAFAEYSSADLLLLDEPFSALDEETSARMLRLLAEFSKDKTLLMVSHREYDSDIADCVIKLS